MEDDYSKVAVRHEAFVAEEKGEVVGILVLIRKNSGMLLDNVAVRPDFQRKGLALIGANACQYRARFQKAPT